MHRKFISYILGAAIAVTSVTASTAQAGSSKRPHYVLPTQQSQVLQVKGNEAFAAVLAGAAALFIIGKTIENNNKAAAQPRAQRAPRAHKRHGGHRHAKGPRRVQGKWKRERMHRHGARRHSH